MLSHDLRGIPMLCDDESESDEIVCGVSTWRDEKRKCQITIREFNGKKTIIYDYDEDMTEIGGDLFYE